MNGKILKEMLLTLSLANLLYIATWRKLLYPRIAEYHVKTGPTSFDYLSAIICVVVTAFLLWVSVRLFKRFYGQKAEMLLSLGFLLLFLIGATTFHLQFPSEILGRWLPYGIQALFAIVFLVSLTKWRRLVIEPLKAIVMILTPFAMFTLGNAVAGLTVPPVRASDEIHRLAQVNSNQAKPVNRVVWIIFDEFDYRIPFELKAAPMPHFEDLMTQSLYATQAESPARFTLESIPSLLTGKVVKKAETSGRNELKITSEDGSSSKLSQTSSIFSEVAELNGTSGAFGYYHPYCQLFDKYLSSCTWERNTNETFTPGTSLSSSLQRTLEDLATPVLFLLGPDYLSSSAEAKTRTAFLNERLTARTNEVDQLVSDRRIDLAFIHLPFPHPPAWYDPTTGAFSEQKQDYVNNLILADSMLGQIRAAIEKAGLWEDTTLIVSTDHPLRIDWWESDPCCTTANDIALTGGIEDPRIPFIIKHRHQDETIRYDRKFNTVITHDLILAIMKGEISTAAETSRWLDARAGY